MADIAPVFLVAIYNKPGGPDSILQKLQNKVSRLPSLIERLKNSVIPNCTALLDDLSSSTPAVSMYADQFLSSSNCYPIRRTAVD